MYLLISDVPIYLEGDRRWLQPTWRRCLVLLRESLGDRLGRVTVLAPTLPLDEASSEDGAPEAIEPGDGLRFVPSIDLRGRAKTYWTRDRARWRSDVRACVSSARAVHCGLAEVCRPLSFEGFREARREGRPTIFELDADAVARREDLAGDAGPLARLGAQVSGTLFEGMTRYAARTADLTLLEAGPLVRRYGAHARIARTFQATSYRTEEVVPARALEDRLRARSPGAPLRVVSWGRLDARSGLDASVDAVRLARQRGAAITLDLFVDGPERRRLESRVAALGLRAAVRLLGRPPGGAALLPRLADYDAQLFTHRVEASARAIFAGFAAGLPLVGFELEPLREVGGAAVTAQGDVGAVARALEELGRDRERLTSLSRAAHRAGLHHAADAWHRRRAEWTFEAVLRHEAGSRGRAAKAA